MEGYTNSKKIIHKFKTKFANTQSFTVCAC